MMCGFDHIIWTITGALVVLALTGGFVTLMTAFIWMK